ncbi:hypothetical protein NL466_29405, partial [Klebsiella pneumoniae]|nr:hypothetical protein [Klebsiella pneumoniae]
NAGNSPWSVAVDVSGKYVYATNRGSKTVSQYAIGANGALTPLTSAPPGTGNTPFSLTTTYAAVLQ